MRKVLRPAKHMTGVTHDSVVFMYMLMKEITINVEEIFTQNMMKFRNKFRRIFCFEG